MAVFSVHALRVSSTCLLPLLEALQDQQALTQDPFKLLLLPWVLEHVRFCVYPLGVESLFPMALQFSWKEKCLLKPNVSWAYLSYAGLLGWEIQCRLGTF